MITTKKIKDLNFSDQIYFIPSYQRGYRWESQQVIELLDDIYEVHTTKQDSYCLQPIVVSEIEPNKYEIIDGQQRLTTIYIILTRLNRFTDEKFQLDFEVRSNCKKFFEDLSSGALNFSNPDFAHISNAYTEIGKWLQSKKENKEDSNIELNIFQTLLEKVEVIWYDVEEKDRSKLIDIFTRLNSGKIPLTNAELVKALFLSKSNYNSIGQDIYTQQLDVSNKWNQIEYGLQDDDLWNFINKTQNDHATRIDYVLQLIVKSKNVIIKEDLDVFRYYYPLYIQSIKNNSSNFVETAWNDVQLFFGILQNWYNNIQHYHLIGLLIWDGVSIIELMKQYNLSNKTNFIGYLMTEIGKRFCNINLQKLNYKDDYEDVERVLVFFNVMESYRSGNTRFPFKRLKQNGIKWSLEHIHPQNALEIKQIEYKQWIDDHLKVLKHLNGSLHNDELVAQAEDLKTALDNSKNASSNKLRFEDISQRILESLTIEDSKDISQVSKSEISFELLGGEHHLANMALLDSKRNSSLGNSAFSVKRKNIIRFQLEGFYVPEATKNSFLKYYSDFPQHLHYWTLEDRDEYVFKIMQQMNYVKNFKSALDEC